MVNNVFVKTIVSYEIDKDGNAKIKDEKEIKNNTQQEIFLGKEYKDTVHHNAKNFKIVDSSGIEYKDISTTQNMVKPEISIKINSPRDSNGFEIESYGKRSLIINYEVPHFVLSKENKNGGILMLSSNFGNYKGEFHLEGGEFEIKYKIEKSKDSSCIRNWFDKYIIWKFPDDITIKEDKNYLYADYNFNLNPTHCKDITLIIEKTTSRLLNYLYGIGTSLTAATIYKIIEIFIRR